MAGRPRVARELEREFSAQVPLCPSWVAAGAVVGVSAGTALRALPRLGASTKVRAIDRSAVDYASVKE